MNKIISKIYMVYTFHKTQMFFHKLGYLFHDASKADSQSLPVYAQECSGGMCFFYEDSGRIFYISSIDKTGKVKISSLPFLWEMLLGTGSDLGVIRELHRYLPFAGDRGLIAVLVGKTAFVALHPLEHTALGQFSFNGVVIGFVKGTGEIVVPHIAVAPLDNLFDKIELYGITLVAEGCDADFKNDDLVIRNFKFHYLSLTTVYSIEIPKILPVVVPTTIVPL